MPNHTDVRATFFGHPDNLARLRRASRELSMCPRAEMVRTASWTGWFIPPPPFDFGHPTPDVHMGDCGGLLSTGLDAPFTLRAGIDMPVSFSVREESQHQLGTQAQELLDSGQKVFKRIRAPRHPELEACATRKDALAWFAAHDPGALRDAERLASNLRDHGAVGWYEWSIKNWSTKWDAYDTSWGDFILGGRLLPVRLQTAWSPPLGALSAMSQRFGVGCAVLYIDEGGGFSDYCIIEPDGVAEEAGLPPGTSSTKLGAACRRAARAGLASLGAKSVSAKEAHVRSTLWPHLMMTGADITPDAFGAGAPEPGSPLAASLALWACSSDNPVPGQLARWLDELSSRGVIGPDTELESGYRLGDALVASGWETGTRWVLREATPARGLELARIGMLCAVQLNAPGAAVAAYQALTACGAELPDATLSGLDKAPETAAALARASSGACRMAFTEVSRTGLVYIDDWCARVGTFMPQQSAKRAHSIMDTRAALEAMLEGLELDEAIPLTALTHKAALRF